MEVKKYMVCSNKDAKLIVEQAVEWLRITKRGMFPAYGLGLAMLAEYIANQKGMTLYPEFAATKETI